MQDFHVKSAGYESCINAANSAEAARQFIRNFADKDGTNDFAQIVCISTQPFDEIKISEIEFLSTAFILKSLNADLSNSYLKVVRCNLNLRNDNEEIPHLKICK